MSELTASSPESEVREYMGMDFVFYDGKPVCQLGRKKALPSEYVHPEPGFQYGRCKMIKADGERCRNGVRAGWSVCTHHGAGFPTSPGGRPPINGRHSKHLPNRLVGAYDEYMSDPDTLSMYSELALMDTRIAELLTRLDGADVKAAWLKIRSAMHRAQGATENPTIQEMQAIFALLRDAVNIRTNDQEIWGQIASFVDARRKIADTERRRIVDARKFLTLQEATAMMSYVVDSVFRHVTDPLARRLISEDLRRLDAGPSMAQLATQQPPNAQIVEGEVDEDGD